jgi:hypothetical protein
VTVRLPEAYLYARSRRQTRVIVLMGGNDYFSNGIHLKVIEDADDPAEESWRNLNAMNDLVREIIETKFASRGLGTVRRRGGRRRGVRACRPTRWSRAKTSY